jgi:hypothetical protein
MAYGKNNAKKAPQREAAPPALIAWHVSERGEKKFWRLCHVRAFYLSIERGALPICLYFNALGPTWSNQIGSKIAYTWRM